MILPQIPLSQAAAMLAIAAPAQAANFTVTKP